VPDTLSPTIGASPRTAVKVVALDWGHTLMDERRDRHVPLDDRPAHLMPGVREALGAIALPLAVWANTREGDERHVRAEVGRARVGEPGPRAPGVRVVRIVRPIRGIAWLRGHVRRRRRVALFPRVWRRQRQEARPTYRRTAAREPSSR
jgi:hypothetical protein